MLTPLYAKAGRETDGTVRAGDVDASFGTHRHEMSGAACIRRTEPPISGGTRSVVLVLNFAVPGGIIGVLCLFVLLVRVSVGNSTENLELRKEEKVIRCRRDVSRRRAAAVCRIVSVLGNGLEDGTKRFRDYRNDRVRIAREARPANVFTHL